jgi:hypothetical protein
MTVVRIPTLPSWSARRRGPVDPRQPCKPCWQRAHPNTAEVEARAAEVQWIRDNPASRAGSVRIPTLPRWQRVAEVQ